MICYFTCIFAIIMQKNAYKMKNFLMITLLSFAAVRGNQTTVMTRLLESYLHKQIANSSSFDLNAELRAAGWTADSAIQQCLFKNNEEAGVRMIKTICNKFYDNHQIQDACARSLNRRLVHIDCSINQPDSSSLNTRQTNNTCYCKTLELHPERVSNDANILTTSDNPECIDEPIKVSKHLFHSQENLTVLALSNIPDITIQPGAFDDLWSLEFVSLADNGLDSTELPPGLFCNNRKLGKLHLQGLQFTTFPSQLFNCSHLVAKMHCLSQLNDVIIQHTSIEIIPPSPFGCVRNIANLLLTNNHLKDISSLGDKDLNSVQQMSFQRNHISSLKPYMFQHLTKLTSLQLSSNRFKNLEAVWFAEARSLRYLNLNDNQITSIDGNLASLCSAGLKLNQNKHESKPDNVHNNSDCLQSLQISSDKLNKIAAGSLLDLYNVRIFNISANNITSMTTITSAFGNSGQKIEHIIMNDNGLTELKELDFLPFNNVILLDLSKNNIEVVHHLAFSNLHILRVLNLGNNLLSHITSQFSALRKLTVLLLGGNRLKTVNAEMFNGLNSLYALSMDYNNIQLIENTSFKDLPYLSNLQLSNNNLIKIDDGVIPASVTVLNLTFNRLEEIPCLRYINNLSHLSLRSNRISLLRKQPECFRKKLRYLDLENNSIKMIEPGAFSNCSQLYSLNLSRNSLRLNFTINYFQGANLQSLSLAVNEIDSLLNLCLHKPMNQLEVLQLSTNPITQVPNLSISKTVYPVHVFPSFVKVSYLSLTNCNITSIHPQAFDRFLFLRKVDLSGNQIRYFQNLQIRNINKLPSGLPIPIVIDIHDNMIECSCRMKWLRTNESLWHIYNFQYCDYPVNDKAVIFNQLSADLFLCKTITVCDTMMCSCFTNRLNSEPSIIDCSNRNSSFLPKIFAGMAGKIYLHKNNYKYLSLSENYSVAYRASILTLHHCNIEKIASSSFAKFTYIEELYLNDNKIQLLQHGTFASLKLLRKLALYRNLLVEISGEVFSSNVALQILRLHNNSLKKLNTKTRKVISNLNYLTTLSLYNNPWICLCDDDSWKKWLSDMHPKLKKFHNIKCDNETVLTFRCPNDIQNVQGYALAVGLSVTLPLAVIIVAALSFYHRHLLAVLVFSYFGVRFNKDETTDTYTYDAILLYDEEPQSNQDYSLNHSIIDFIHTWMTSVDPPYKVMLPIVDIPGGTNWAEEIARGISNSKKSVLYITMGFLEKQQTMNIFGICYSTSMDRQTIDLILIIDDRQTLNYLRSAHVNDPRLKALLRANKYVLYHDKHFFKKFIYLLPGQKRSLITVSTEEQMLEEL